MMIWRNLDPKLLAALLVAAAETVAAKRKPESGRRPPEAPFRTALAEAAEPHHRTHRTTA